MNCKCNMCMYENENKHYIKEIKSPPDVLVVFLTASEV